MTLSKTPQLLGKQNLILFKSFLISAFKENIWDKKLHYLNSAQLNSVNSSVCPAMQMMLNCLTVFLSLMSSLTVTLDKLSVSLSLSLNTSESQVVQPNLVVQSAQIPAVDTQGVQFTSFSGLSVSI